MSTPLSSADLNLLVYRYLVESGFEHAAYTFGYQALVHKHTSRDKEIPPACLITIVQKGLQYIELEANLGEVLQDVSGDFSCLSAREVLTKSSAELRTLVQHRREIRELQREQFRERLAQDADVGPSRIEQHQIRVLEGHKGEVYTCKWSPAEPDLLATSASDKSARFWRIGDEDQSQELHHPGLQDPTVGTLEWSADGNYLATGTHDGIARIWSRDGILQHTMDEHSAPIFSIKWSKKGDFVAMASLDKTASVWSSKTGLMKQRTSLHKAYILDIDWKNSSIFATCSADKTVKAWKVGEAEPIKVFNGHLRDVNSVKWDPQGRLLASCSDDGTARIWSLTKDASLQVLAGHQKEIYTMTWSPVPIENLSLTPVTLLATGSFDTTIRLWDADNGMCAGVLSGHSQPVYSLAFSPDCRFLASASFDKLLNIWSIPDGKLLKQYQHSAGIFEVSWNSTGELLAASSEDNLVVVLDLSA